MSVICMNCKQMEFKMRSREQQITDLSHLLEDIKLALYAVKVGKQSSEIVVDAVMDQIDKYL